MPRRARLKKMTQATTASFIAFVCPQCSTRVKAPAKGAGHRGRCPVCHNRVRVPLPGSSPSAAAAPIAPKEKRQTITAASSLSDTVDNQELESGPAIQSTPPVAPAQRPRVRKKAILLIGAPICLVLLGIGTYIAYDSDRSAAARRALMDADDFFAAGKLPEAAVKYRLGFAEAGSRKSEIIKQVVEQAIKMGRPDIAKEWVDRSLTDRVDVEFGTDAAKNVHEEAKKWWAFKNSQSGKKN